MGTAGHHALLTCALHYPYIAVNRTRELRVRELIRGTVVRGNRLFHARELDDHRSLIFYSLERFYGCATNYEPAATCFNRRLQRSWFTDCRGFAGITRMGRSGNKATVSAWWKGSKALLAIGAMQHPDENARSYTVSCMAVLSISSTIGKTTGQY